MARGSMALLVSNSPKSRQKAIKIAIFHAFFMINVPFTNSFRFRILSTGCNRSAIRMRL